MQIECGSCGRAFDLDERRVGDLTAARCVCGVQVPLRAVDGRVLPCRLGKYVLLTRIAAGGMGEIYYGKLAGAEGFERSVAIKKLLAHLSGDRAFIDMMVKEAKLTVLLNHPNVVQVHDLAREADTYYIAMEYVPGITVGTLLDRILERGQLLPVEVAVYITSQVLRGLAYAHDLPGPDGAPITILHRDITPQNIMVTRHGWVKITDFGIARALNEISTTSPGTLKGKLGYVAPEQLAGLDPDRRVDIFCAGILLWEMLAAQRLFKGSSEAETFRKIAQARAAPLRGGIRQDVTEELELVVQRALARDRDARFASADAFCEALSHALFPQSVDDCRQATKRFLGQHGDLFDHAECPMRAPAGAAAASPDDLELPAAALADITSLTAPRKHPRGVAWAASLLVALGAAVGVGMHLGPWARAQAEWLAVWAGGPAAASAPQPGVVRPDAPVAVRPLSTPEIQAVIRRHAAPISACLRGVDRRRAPARVDAQITIAPNGLVADVRFSPAIAVASLHACLDQTLRGLRFRSQPVDGFRVTIPLEFGPM